MLPTRKPNKLLSIRLPSDMEQPFAGSSGQDDTGYKQHIEKLDQQEATLKCLLRKWVAGFLTGLHRSGSDSLRSPHGPSHTMALALTRRSRRNQKRRPYSFRWSGHVDWHLVLFQEIAVFPKASLRRGFLLPRPWSRGQFFVRLGGNTACA